MTIILYNEDPDIDISEIADYLRKETHLSLETKGNLISSLHIKKVAREFAKVKVVDIAREIENQPLPKEIEYEEKRFISKEKSGLLYDGYGLQEIFRGLLKKEKTSLDYCNIIFIKELFGTYENKRYHIRVSLYGFPSIISLSGIVEAPARPREYYIKKRLGVSEEALKEEFPIFRYLAIGIEFPKKKSKV